MNPHAHILQTSGLEHLFLENLFFIDESTSCLTDLNQSTGLLSILLSQISHLIALTCIECAIFFSIGFNLELVVIFQLLKWLNQEAEDIEQHLLVAVADQVVKNAAQVFVENHSEGKATLVDVYMETSTDSHHNYLNYLLKFISWHRYFVQESLWT